MVGSMVAISIVTVSAVFAINSLRKINESTQSTQARLGYQRIEAPLLEALRTDVAPFFFNQLKCDKLGEASAQGRPAILDGSTIVKRGGIGFKRMTASDFNAYATWDKRVSDQKYIQAKNECLNDFHQWRAAQGGNPATYNNHKIRFCLKIVTDSNEVESSISRKYPPFVVIDAILRNNVTSENLECTQFGQNAEAEPVWKLAQQFDYSMYWVADTGKELKMHRNVHLHPYPASLNQAEAPVPSTSASPSASPSASSSPTPVATTPPTPKYFDCTALPYKGMRFWHVEQCMPGMVTIIMNDGGQVSGKQMTCCPTAYSDMLSTNPAEINQPRTGTCGQNEVQTGVVTMAGGIGATPFQPLCTKVNTAKYKTVPAGTSILTRQTDTHLNPDIYNILSEYSLYDACLCPEGQFMAGGHSWIDDQCVDSCVKVEIKQN
jgi:hypothetical protein